MKGDRALISRLNDRAIVSAPSQSFFPCEKDFAAHGFFPNTARCSNSMTHKAPITMKPTVDPSARTTGMPLNARTPNDAAAVSADIRTETGGVSRRYADVAEKIE